MTTEVAAPATTALNARVDTLDANVGVLVSPDATPDVMALEPEAVKSLVRDHGAVLFKGFAVDADGFEAFSDQFSDQYMNNRGSGSWRKTVNPRGDGTIQNVAYIYGVGHQRTFPLPLHADRAYVKSTPEVMWFMCGRPADKDGETTVCDGIKVYQHLSEGTRSLFDTTRLKYIRHYEEGEWQVLYQTQDVEEVVRYCKANDMGIEVGDDNTIRTEFIKTAVPLTKWQRTRAFVNSMQIGLWQEHGLKRQKNFVRMEDGSPVPEDVVAEVNEVSEGLTANIPWAPGDFAIVDNTRMLHGRRSFEDQQREIYVRMCRKVDW